MTQRLLTFSRKQMLSAEITDLNAQTHEMEELLRRTLGEIIEIETVYADDLWNCRVISLFRGALEIRDTEYSISGSGVIDLTA